MGGLACRKPEPPPKVELPEPPVLGSSPAPKKDELAELLQSVEAGDFTFVYIFRRKDGGVFDKADKQFLRNNAPSGINRWVKTDDNKIVIAGSNYMFTPEQLANLQNRFSVEDRSKVKPEDLLKKKSG